MAAPWQGAHRPGTLERLRRLRESFLKPSAVAPDRRRAEDRLREEHQDAHAKTIFADKPVEQRRYRSDSELRKQREELERAFRAGTR
jgi:aminoglycoside phosphotransferase family enzyme